MPAITTILFLIYALRAHIVGATPVPSIGYTLRNDIQAGVTITVWHDTVCGGHYNGSKPTSQLASSWDRSLTYGEMSYSNTTIRSYVLSRFLSSDERLDWSIRSNASLLYPEIPEDCGTFVQRTSPDKNGNPLHQDICYPLKPGATVCPIS